MSKPPLDFPEAFEVSDPLDPHESLTGPFYMRKGGPIGEVYLLAERKHCNTGGSVHGGLLMTMADLALCAACRDGLEGERAITVSLNAEFLAAGMEGDFIEAKAELTRRGSSMAPGIPRSCPLAS
ncbi:MAG: PaaI family thioesterase [Alphaproteobacteria bacterium]